MPEMIADTAASGCFSLHFRKRNEQNQSLAPDLLPFSARARALARDKTGRFAPGRSGNPRGRPRGIPNPQRRMVTLQAFRKNPEACQALFRRQPPLLRRLLRQFLPVSAQDPADRLGAPRLRDPHAGAGSVGHTPGLVGLVARRDRHGRGSAHRAAARCPAARRAAGRARPHDQRAHPDHRASRLSDRELYGADDLQSVVRAARHRCGGRADGGARRRIMPAFSGRCSGSAIFAARW